MGGLTLSGVGGEVETSEHKNITLFTLTTLQVLLVNSTSVKLKKIQPLLCLIICGLPGRSSRALTWGLFYEFVVWQPRLALLSVAPFMFLAHAFNSSIEEALCRIARLG